MGDDDAARLARKREKAREHPVRMALLARLARPGATLDRDQLREAVPGSGDLPASTLGYHLLVLRDAALVAAAGDPQRPRYRLADATPA